MRWLLILLLVPAAFASESALGFACGVVHSNVTLHVVGAADGRPIAGAAVTFYSEMEVALRRSAQQAKKRGLPAEEPPGTTVHSDDTGAASITCEFRHSDQVLASGKRRQEVFGSGEFHVRTKQGVTSVQTAEALLGSGPLSDIPSSITLRVPTSPNQSLEPTSGVAR